MVLVCIDLNPDRFNVVVVGCELSQCVKSVLLIHDVRNCLATYLKLEVYDLATENGVVVCFF